MPLGGTGRSLGFRAVFRDTRALCSPFWGCRWAKPGSGGTLLSLIPRFGYGVVLTPRSAPGSVCGAAGVIPVGAVCTPKPAGVCCRDPVAALGHPVAPAARAGPGLEEEPRDSRPWGMSL